MVFKAIEFVARAHALQFRKGSNAPYIIHPLGVAKALIEMGCSEAIVVGVLHDTSRKLFCSISDRESVMHCYTRCLGA